MQTKTSPLQAALVKKLHTICTVSGINKEEKAAMLTSYGVESSKELTIAQLSDLIDKLNKEPEMWRKRCMASVFGWLEVLNKEASANYVIGIICKSAQEESFNKIPVNRLRDIYYEFVNKAKTIKHTQAVKAEIINDLISKN